jgi:hypothetical protein
MCAFIVNPAIEHDEDYYRDDQAVIDDILGGRALLVIGLRRSGKTSLLYRVQRAAEACGRACEYLDLREADDTGLDRAWEPATVLLLDELEVARDWDRARAGKLARAIRGAIVVAAAAPGFWLDASAQPDWLQPLVERLQLHVLGPLSDAEARDLLTQRKRGGAGPLVPAMIDALLARGERLPITLQALGEEAAGSGRAAVSLHGFGARVLTGLTEAAVKLLVDAAHGAPIAAGRETELLIQTGALQRNAGAPSIASALLAEHVQLARPRAASSTEARPLPTCWQRHARILHLSDLHFGAKAIDPPETQAHRMFGALERADCVPDFVVVSGDLSWSGHRSELKDAEAFLELVVRWMCAKHGRDDLECRRRIVIVPGNHEASWSLSRGLQSKKRPPTEDELEHWARYSLGPFANFVNRFYRGTRFWDLDEPCLVAVFDQPSVAFLSLSTAHYITEKSGDARFGEHLIERARHALGGDAMQRARFRLGVWHHNLRAFQNQPGAIADADLAVRTFLTAAPALDLALHGHVHQGEVDVFRPRQCSQVLPYSAVGSFGVEASHRPGDSVRGVVHNQLAVVELQTSAIGRRMVTEFYDLTPDGNMQWTWERVRVSEPQTLLG